MSLYEQIKEAYPELDREFTDGTIVLQNDGDEKGDYIAKWSYIKPIPENLLVKVYRG